MKLGYEGICEVGVRRDTNQDAIGMFCIGDKGLFLVADGMGGHSEGERASRAIRDACREWWDNRILTGGCRSFLKSLEEIKQTLALVNRNVWETTGESQTCGSTVVLLWIYGTDYAILWSGDSRCYLAEKSFWSMKMKQLTSDDVWEHQTELTAGLSRKEIEMHKNHGKLVRALGVQPDFVCTVQTGRIHADSMFVLCSDGIYKYIEERQLEACVKAAFERGRMLESLNAICGYVYQNHAPDNLSCIMVKAMK